MHPSGGTAARRIVRKADRILSMLRLQDILSFQDIIGRRYHTAGMIAMLYDGDTVYAVAGEPELVFVRIARPTPALIQAIRLMLHRNTAGAQMDRVLWPELECRWPQSKDFCGFLAKSIPGLEKMVPLADWIKIQNGCGLPVRERVPVGRSLLQSIRQVCQGPDGYILGRFSAENFAVAPWNQVYFVDSWHCGNLICDHVGKAAPEQQVNTMDIGRYHRLHDSFQLGMLLFELLTGLPAFGGHDPGAEFSSQQIGNMVADGESVFFYEYLPECGAVLERLKQEAPHEEALLRRTLDYADWEDYTQFRPDMEEWFETLLVANKNIQNGGAY